MAGSVVAWGNGVVHNGRGTDKADVCLDILIPRLYLRLSLVQFLPLAHCWCGASGRAMTRDAATSKIIGGWSRGSWT